MTVRTAGVPLLTLGLTAAYVAGQAPASRSTAADQDWTPPRLADGQPDITGVYSNATYTPFERPSDLADREFFTPEEAEAYARQRLDNLHNQAPAGSGVPSNVHYPLTKTPDMLYEYGCHEGNYGIVNILRGQRVAEAAERAAQRGN